jgi:hypothetical protein
MADPRYPLGKYQPPVQVSAETRNLWIGHLEAAPGLLAEAVSGLTAEQLDTPYREGGWSSRQIAHHLPDSHFNSYARFKLALTEERPTIRPYLQGAWADLPDNRDCPVEVSIRLLEALHQRWTALLKAMTPEQYQRVFIHPETGREHSLEWTLGLYAWHGEHHVAQIASLRTARSW